MGPSPLRGAEEGLIPSTPPVPASAASPTSPVLRAEPQPDRRPAAGASLPAGAWKLGSGASHCRQSENRPAASVVVRAVSTWVTKSCAQRTTRSRPRWASPGGVNDPARPGPRARAIRHRGSITPRPSPRSMLEHDHEAAEEDAPPRSSPALGQPLCRAGRPRPRMNDDCRHQEDRAAPAPAPSRQRRKARRSALLHVGENSARAPRATSACSGRG